MIENIGVQDSPPIDASARTAAGESADRKYVAYLALAASLILILGVWARPEQGAQEPVMSPAETLRLQRLSQRRSVQEMAAFFSDVAATAAPHLVRLTDLDQTAICWDSEGTLVTSISPTEFPSSSEVRTLGEWQGEALTTIISPVTPVVALRVDPEAALPPVRTISPDLLLPGDWLLAVARRPDGRYTFAPGIYGGDARVSCGDFEFQEITTNINLNRSMLGGGLFDLDENLLGIIVYCRERIVALAAVGVNRALGHARAFEAQVLERYGFRAGSSQPSSTEETDKGVLVTEVWSGDAADRAGLLPGDWIIALDGRPVSDKEDLFPMILPVAHEKVELRVQRGARARTIQISTQEELLSSSADNPVHRGIAFRNPGRGVLIETIVPGSPAHEAGLRPGDRVLFVDGREARSTSTVQQVLAQQKSKPVEVVAERDSRKRLFLLN